GSWKDIPLTQMNPKFFATTGEDKEGTGDYVTQIYCLCSYAPAGRESILYAGTNLNGGIYQTTDGENWKEAFTTDEDRIHALVEFKGRLYAGSSSKGKIYAYDG